MFHEFDFTIFFITFWGSSLK